MNHMKINESISISQSPEKIWDFWMPVTTDTQWRDCITKAEWTSQPPYGKDSTASYHVEPENGGCHVSLNAKMTGPLFMRIMMIFMGGMMKRGVKSDLLKLKEIMEEKQ